MNYSIREALASEWPEIVRVTNEAFQVENFFKRSERTSLADVRAQIEEHGAHFLLAFDEAGRVCASIMTEAEGERAYFGMLAVDPQRQRSGLGRRMIAAAEQWGVEQGCSRMEMCIIDLRKDLPDYYRSLGYAYSREAAIEADEARHFSRPVKFLYMVKPLTSAAAAR